MSSSDSSGHANLGITSIYLQGIDDSETIDTVCARRTDAARQCGAALTVLVQLSSEGWVRRAAQECRFRGGSGVSVWALARRPEQAAQSDIGDSSHSRVAGARSPRSCCVSSHARACPSATRRLISRNEALIETAVSVR
jgi:hypothetical protein